MIHSHDTRPARPDTDSTSIVEVVVSRLIAAGFDDEAIAQRVGVSLGTVRAYRRQFKVSGLAVASLAPTTKAERLSGRRCVRCGALLERKRKPSGNLETWDDFGARKSCGRRCDGTEG